MARVTHITHEDRKDYYRPEEPTKLSLSAEQLKRLFSEQEELIRKEMENRE